jgi:hypothetical protein
MSSRLMSAMIKISAAEFSASGRCPGGKQHVRIHVVGPGPPGSTSPRIPEHRLYITWTWQDDQQYTLPILVESKNSNLLNTGYRHVL